MHNCIIGARGLGERHCCHFDQISTNQPNRHHITSHHIVQCRRLRRGRGQLSVLSHDLRLGSAGHQVVCSFFVWFLNIRNRIVDNDVGVRSLCGRLDICRTPASTRPVGSVRPLQKVNLGFVDLWMRFSRLLHIFVDTMNRKTQKNKEKTPQTETCNRWKWHSKNCSTNENIFATTLLTVVFDG